MDVVIGYFSGEIIGVYVVGVLSLLEVIIIVYYRGFIMKESVWFGVMVVVGLGLEDVILFLVDGVIIVVENSLNLIIIFGDIFVVE